MNNFEVMTFESAADFLKNHDNYLIFTHSNPDPDTLGSAAALVINLRGIGKTAVAICDSPIPERLRFLTENEYFIKSVSSFDGYCLVSVDIASCPMLGIYEDEFKLNRKFELSIDHHLINTVRTERKLVCSGYASNGEIIYELTSFLGAHLNKENSMFLFAAMSSDSGGFRFSATRPETYEYAANLIRHGADFVDIYRRLFEQKTVPQFELEKAAYNNLERYYDGRVALVCITDEMLEQAHADSSDIDSINQLPRQLLGVEVSAVIRSRVDCVKVSLRSNNYFDVAALAQSFGGGGHFHAAGFRIDGTVFQARDALLKALEGKLL